MASAANGNVNASTASETTVISEPIVDKSTADVISKPTNGENNSMASAEGQTVKEAESSEKRKSVEHASAPSSIESKEPTVVKKPEQTSASNKRAHRLTTASDGADKPGPEKGTAPANKKQKTAKGQKSKASGAATSHLNGEKKTTSRAKKVNDVKKTIPTDGIGSRTRSRTKASS
ncbi:hypothetical protein BDV25DRAFT_48724 [Aspergillus avenaceus]|uniref:Uncharacterized protein n=1 Tax=Aspergillus avenaceus TaxID=36643 RepID=A0A5N6TJN7_ASPAV|nr:hypothetical protein BDV25DRAFT_48724 [Aspergillus avenaceus]